MPIFRVKSVKIYTGQKKFTRAPSVASVTNMRYAHQLRIIMFHNNTDIPVEEANKKKLPNG